MVVNKRQNNKGKSVTHVGSLETTTSSVSKDQEDIRSKPIVANSLLLVLILNKQ